MPAEALDRESDEKGLDCGGVFCAPCVTCSDGVQNGDEAGVDCGGTKCGPCAAPSCNDAKHNGMETGVDCGGPCAPCAPPTCAGATCSFDLGDLGQVVDYDVAGDGSAFYLSSHWQPSGATWLSVSCARPDGSLIRSKVALEGYAPNSGHARSRLSPRLPSPPQRFSQAQPPRCGIDGT